MSGGCGISVIWLHGDPFLWWNKVLSKVVLSGAIKDWRGKTERCFALSRAVAWPWWSPCPGPSDGRSPRSIWASFCLAVSPSSCLFKLWNCLLPHCLSLSAITIIPCMSALEIQMWHWEAGFPWLPVLVLAILQQHFSWIFCTLKFSVYADVVWPNI